MQVLTSLLLASALLPLAPQRVDRLTWNPAAGTQLQRTVSRTLVSVTDEALLQMNGDEQDAGSGMERTTESTIVAADLFGEPKEGSGPGSIQRTFDTVAHEVDIAGQPEGVLVRGTEGGSGPMEGLAVDFTWDADSGAYEPSWQPGAGGEDRWLSGLKADMDGASFLPSEPVEAGDRWEVDLAAASDLLWPGGRVFVEEDSNLADDHDIPDGGIVILVPSSGGIRRLDELKGKLNAKYSGRREVDGRSLGVIELDLELDGELDVCEDLQDSSPIDQAFDTATLGLSYEGQGELLWDLEGHHMAGFSFEVAVESELDAAWTVGNDDFSMEVTFQGAHSQSHALEVKVESVEAE